MGCEARQILMQQEAITTLRAGGTKEKDYMGVQFLGSPVKAKGKTDRWN